MIRNQNGQSLVEYLIIVALVAVGTTAVMRVVGQNVSGQFARISNVLRGAPAEDGVQMDKFEASHIKKRDLSDFMNGAASK